MVEMESLSLHDMVSVYGIIIHVDIEDYATDNKITDDDDDMDVATGDLNTTVQFIRNESHCDCYVVNVALLCWLKL